MTNLPSLYARVVAKRPDLAVEGLAYEACWCGCGERWHLNDDGHVEYPKIKRVEDSILARWVEALPEEAWLGRPTTPVHGWRVCYRNKRAETTYDLVCFSPIEQSPIEALAAFYLGQET